MKLTGKIIASYLTGAELGIIALLGIHLYRVWHYDRQTVFAPISRDTLVFPEGELKYFYEPVADTVDRGNEWVPYKAQYSINADALNERYNYSPGKPARTYRIITLGDSYTYGLYVNTADNYSEKLEDLLNAAKPCPEYTKYEVINLGMQGYDLQYSQERFHRRGVKYSPNLVVWLIKNDDFQLINELFLPLEKKYADEMHANGEFDRQVAAGNLYPSWNKAGAAFSVMYKSATVVAKQGAFINDVISRNPGFTALVSMSNLTDENRHILEKIAHDHLRVTFFAGLPDVKSIPSLSFAHDGHPNMSGHTAIARSLEDFVTTTYLKCQGE